MDSSQKLIRSSGIPREPPHQMFRLPSWEMAAHGLISRPQAFWARYFFQNVLLFLMNSSQKLSRSSEILREPPIKFEWNSFKG